ncbi:MAG: phenylalanine--tRNA ligase subunit alpha [Tissierellia bacterium]|nr:phenylalanine--tRNA ligase subunit alpha [Tissierellia bacterium]
MECEREMSQIESLETLEEIRIRYLGKKGKLTDILKNMGKLSAEERPKMGKIANEIRDELETFISEKKEALTRQQREEKIRSEYLDISAPAKTREVGHLHPLTETKVQLENLFLRMGFRVIDGPQIETVKNNFDMLNTPDDHPSRDPSDTFYVDKNHVLRSQTSPVQIRAMLEYGAPIKMISAGRTFRNDEVDDTHSPMFHQIEGLVVDKGITIGHLKSTIDIVLEELFGEKLKTRYRPHYFPFTEPSLEVDVTCTHCHGKGCPKCSLTGWSMELLGCGMVHPQVLKNCGIDPEVYTGFAFGMGLDRLTMVKHGIHNLRLLFDNDKRFLEQF